jgi:hypothetical protein
LGELVPEVAVAMTEVIDRALAREPGLRYESMRAFRDALVVALGLETVPSTFSAATSQTPLSAQVAPATVSFPSARAVVVTDAVQKKRSREVLVTALAVIALAALVAVSLRGKETVVPTPRLPPVPRLVPVAQLAAEPAPVVVTSPPTVANTPVALTLPVVAVRTLHNNREPDRVSPSRPAHTRRSSTTVDAGVRQEHPVVTTGINGAPVLEP